MKTAKKVLSIVLSIAMILGTVVVAASALDGTETAYWTLKAQVTDANGAQEAVNSGYEDTPNTANPTVTKQRADKTAYTKVADQLKVYTSADTIYVQPGQAVWVTTHLRTTDNLCPGEMQAQFYYSTSMFTSTTATYAQVSVWNTDGVFMTYASGNGGAPYSRMTASNRTKYQPSTWTAEQKAAYHEYNWMSTTDPDASDGSFYPLNEDLVSVPVYVKPDAKIGTKGQIFMTTETKYLIIGDADGGDAYASLERISNHDVSAAVLNFVVGTEPSGVDYSALQAAIASYEALNSSDYTADSWATAASAYTAAKAALSATAQDDVDAAATALQNAIKALVPATVLDFTRLNAAIASVPSDLSGYTTSTAAAVTSALADANAALSAETQGEIDAAAIALENAVAALAAKANVVNLQAAVNEAATYDSSLYTTDSWAALTSAVAAAQAILDNADDTSDQTAVDNATTAVNTAIDNLVSLGADFTALKAALDDAATLTESNYTAISWAPFAQAVSAGQTMYNNQASYTKADQATIDAAVKAITDAKAALVFAGADFTALEAALNDAKSLVESYYTADSWSGLATAVAAGQAIVDNKSNYNKSNQAEIDAATKAITDAKAALVEADADYSAVTVAQGKVPTDLSVYTDETVATLNAALAAVQTGLKAKDQAKVDKFAADIEAAVAGLTLKAADLTALNAAIAEAEALNSALYTPDSFAAVTTALDAAKAARDAATDITKQADVDAAATALNEAIDALVYAGADFTALDKALSDAAALVESHYTAESWANLASAVAAGKVIADNKGDYTTADQATIDAAAQAINDAIAALVEADADYSAVKTQQDAAKALKESNYTTDSWANLQSALDAVVTGLKAKDQATVDGFATAIESAIAALVLVDADYTLINQFLGMIDKLTETDYTKASWANLMAAKDAIVFGLKADRQAEVTVMENNLVTAYYALVKAPGADYTSVNEAVAAFEALDASLYTDESVAAVEAAIDAVDWTLNENFQGTVDGYAEAINTAIAALELKPVAGDYTAVNEQIAIFNALVESEYTAESWAAVEAEIAKVNWNLTADDQQTIDGYAVAIRTAIAALEKAPVKGRVLEATYTPSAYRFNSYTFKVEGRAVKIRLVEVNNTAATLTIPRNAANVTIVSYDANGNVVSSLSRDLAYEVWTVDMSINPGDYYITARDNTSWEELDVAKLFKVTLSTDRKDVKSIVPASETVTSGEKFNVTVVTGVDVLKVQILVDDQTAGIQTFNVQDYGTLGDDSCTYNVTARVVGEGTHTLKVRVRTADGWEVVDTVTATVTA